MLGTQLVKRNATYHEHDEYVGFEALLIRASLTLHGTRDLNFGLHGASGSDVCEIFSELDKGSSIF